MDTLQGTLTADTSQYSEQTADRRIGESAEIFFSTASIPALGTTQPPIQWEVGAHSTAVKRSRNEADCSYPSNAKLSNGWSYASTPPIHVHSV
jgi:hypothetical protein